MHNPAQLLLTVLGPTASGKTGFAAGLADRIEGEIISADSRQVYRKMDIGTGKDLADYVVKGRKIPYHLIDIVDAGYKYSVFEFQRDFIRAFEDITGRGKYVLLCGGSGMYIESVLNAWEMAYVPRNDKLRKELAQKSDEVLVQILSSYRKLHNVSDISSRSRLLRAIEIEVFTAARQHDQISFPKFDHIIFGIGSERELLRKRITDRLEKRLREGMVEEVRQLLDEGIAAGDLLFYGLEYKFITLYLTGEIDYDEMKSRLNIAIHQFSKRQMTWFRKMERNGYKIHWLDAEMSLAEKVNKALALINLFYPYELPGNFLNC
jgi:tRNA dimethylallyltransferase